MCLVVLSFRRLYYCNQENVLQKLRLEGLNEDQDQRVKSLIGLHPQLINGCGVWSERAREYVWGGYRVRERTVSPPIIVVCLTMDEREERTDNLTNHKQTLITKKPLRYTPLRIYTSFGKQLYKLNRYLVKPWIWLTRVYLHKMLPTVVGFKHKLHVITYTLEFCGFLVTIPCRNAKVFIGAYNNNIHAITTLVE